MATIDNAAENDAVQDLADPLGSGRCSDHLWTGLISSTARTGRTDGTWSWSDGTQVSYENWGHTQLDGGGSPPICGGMYVWGTQWGEPGTWFDHECDHRFNPGCYACMQTGISSETSNSRACYTELHQNSDCNACPYTLLGETNNGDVCAQLCRDDP